MEAHYRPLIRDLDAIEVLSALGAFPGARWRMQSVEHALWEFLEAQRALNGGGQPASDDLLWKLCLRLRGGVEAKDRLQVSAAISDLKAELTARVHPPPAEGPAAVH